VAGENVASGPFRTSLLHLTTGALHGFRKNDDSPVIHVERAPLAQARFSAILAVESALSERSR
jgi:hypothetical protein